jgi:hypothetical protein
MPPSDIARLRLLNQRLVNPGLIRPALATPAEVVSHLVAVQAQDYAGATWALALRMSAARLPDIEQVFNEGTILRTHLLRPTWHFVTPADIRLLLFLTAPRVQAVNAGQYRSQGLDRAMLRRTNDALAEALVGGRQLTREELRGELEARGLSAGSGLRMGYIMMCAELDGVVCSGPRRGRQFTYALLEERAPAGAPASWSEPDREEALAEFAGRYIAARGPASAHDFAGWSGLTVSEARRGLNAAGERLRVERLQGKEMWLPASAPDAGDVPAGGPPALLLSIYDEYIAGYKERSAMVSEEVAGRLWALGSALRFIIVLDGQVTGVWRRTVQRRAVQIELTAFLPLSTAQREAVAAAGQRYAEFLGLPVELRFN